MMMKTELKRAFFSLKFILSIIGGLILFLHPVLLAASKWTLSTPMELFSMAMGLSDFTPFAVIFAVIPYGSSFCEDYRSTYANSIISKIGFSKYIRYRWAAVTISGATVMGIIMTTIVILCKSVASIPETVESVSFLNGGPWAAHNLPLLTNGTWFYLLRIALAMLFGALWSSVALMLSALIPYTYLAQILPFVIYQMLWYLLEGTIWNPLYYFRADFQRIPSLEFAFAYQSIWILLIAIATHHFMRRRLLA